MADDRVRTYRARIDALVRVGRRLAVARDESRTAEARIWQRDCASLIGELSGGRKVHWLARAFSEAFLVTSTNGADGRVVTEADPAVLIGRLVTVLERAATSLDSLESAEAGAPALADTTETSRRYAFVPDEALRSSLAQADAEAEAAIARGDFGLALVGSSSVLEALLTDAIARSGDHDLATLADWSFADRIVYAETRRLISAACARLPDTARSYRALLTPDGEIRSGVEVAEGDAVRTRQVLRIVTRDLAPGR